MLANFCWKQETTVWYISVQGCDWIRTLVQFATMILLLLSIGRLHQSEKRSESEMWSRYNGVLHRSAQNYWPLSRFPLSSTHHPQHLPLISSPSGRGFQEELRIVNHAFVLLLHYFTESILLSFNIQRQLRPAMLSRINQNSKWSSKELRWQLNNWPASKHISLCNYFLFISSFPSCSIYYSPFFHLHFTLWLLTETLNWNLSITAYTN